MRRTIVYVGMSKKSNTAKSRNFNRKLIIGDFDGEYGPLSKYTLQ